MSQLKGAIAVGVIVFLAFFTGYKQDALERLWQRMLAANPDPVQPVKQDAVLVQSGADAVSPPAETVPIPAPPQGEKQAQPAHGLNPMGSQDSLRRSLDAIRPNKVPEERRQYRNAYFDKLSQQLKELQGEAPPQTSTSPPPPPAPAAAYEGIKSDAARAARVNTEAQNRDIPPPPPTDMEPPAPEQFIEQVPEPAAEQAAPEPEFVEQVPQEVLEAQQELLRQEINEVLTDPQ